MAEKKWSRTVSIRSLLSADYRDETAVEVAKEIAKRLDAAIPEGDPLRTVSYEELIEDFKQLEVHEDVNRCLDRLYDWGDRGRRLFVAID